MEDESQFTLAAQCYGGPRDGEVVPCLVDKDNREFYFPQVVGFKTSDGRRFVYEIDVKDEAYIDSEGQTQFIQVHRYHYLKTEREDEF